MESTNIAKMLFENLYFCFSKIYIFVLSFRKTNFKNTAKRTDLNKTFCHAVSNLRKEMEEGTTTRH